jgi:hypothetical protein
MATVFWNREGRANRNKKEWNADTQCNSGGDNAEK